jgi:hypothetical protein
VSKERISLISIVFHINYNLIENLPNLTTANESDIQLKEELMVSIYDSFKIMCGMSSPQPASLANYDWINTEQFKTMIVTLQQSALTNSMTLKSIK